MSLVKSAVLSLGLLAGVAAAAHAQSDSVAALPPNAGAAPQAAAIAPSGPYPGPNPGSQWSGKEQHTQAVTPSSAYPGPNPGSQWYGKEQETQAVAPSGVYPGPRPN